MPECVLSASLLPTSVGGRWREGSLKKEGGGGGLVFSPAAGVQSRAASQVSSSPMSKAQSSSVRLPPPRASALHPTPLGVLEPLLHAAALRACDHDSQFQPQQ